MTVPDPFDMQRFAVVDVEGNGQAPPDIIEIAIVPIDHGAIGDGRSWLVQPPRPVTSFVTTRVHGITNADLADAPSWTTVADDILHGLDNRIPVAHNASVEYKVLQRHLPDWEPIHFMDTLKLARAIWPELPRHGLDDLISARGIRLGARYGQRHRALYDAHAAARIFVDLIGYANSAGLVDKVLDLGALVKPPTPAPEGLW